MGLDPQLVDWFARLARELGPIANPDARGRRERFLAITAMLRVPDAPGVTVRRVDMALDGRTLGAELAHPGGMPPLIVYAHGGGWVLGSSLTHSDYCRRVAAESGVAVLSIDYRLAPEHPFPAPCDDMFEALCWAVANAAALGVDANRVAVGGDSAGAHLAAVAAIAARDRGGPAPRLQWLIYPTIEPRFDHGSAVEFAQGPGLLTADMRYFWDALLSGNLDSRDARAVPSRASSLAGLSPAYVLTAEFDPLRDEGEGYAAALARAGVPVTQVRAAGMTHGFARLFPVCEAAGRHVSAAARFLGDALA